MGDNPFTKDHYIPPSKKDGTLGFEPVTLVVIAVWIVQAMVSGLLGNAFTEFMKQFRRRKGQPGVDELKAQVLKELKKVKRKPGVSNEDLQNRVDAVFKDVTQL